MKDRIVQAAADEIMHRGLKFSMRDLSGRLGVSTKTIYQFFESKEHLMGCMVKQSISEMKEKENQLMNDSSLSTRQKLEQALVVLPQGLAFFDIRVLNELKKSYPVQWKTVDAYLNQGWEQIRFLVREGLANGQLRPFDLELFIQMYVAGLYHFMDRQSVGHTGLSLEEALSSMVDILLCGICKEPADH